MLSINFNLRGIIFLIIPQQIAAHPQIRKNVRNICQETCAKCAYTYLGIFGKEGPE
jgi:hypothetical protein